MNFSASENEIAAGQGWTSFFHPALVPQLSASKASKMGLCFFSMDEIIYVDSGPLYMDLKEGDGSEQAGPRPTRITQTFLAI